MPERSSGRLPAVEQPAATVASPTWDGPAPEMTVIIASFGRHAMLAGLLGCLERQDLSTNDFEVILVDNGSEDDTWPTLSELVPATSVRAIAVRRVRNFGPGPARNMGLQLARGEFVAFTDDDCLPAPGWLTGLLGALRAGWVAVQGRVEPPPGVGLSSPWDHEKWVTKATPFFETCNVAYPRRRLEEVGGFRVDDAFLTPEKGHPFGEDAELAWRVLSRGGERAFASDAVVHHRIVPQPFRRWLWEQRQCRGFPGLARRSPIVARWLRGGVFLSRYSASFVGALAAIGAGLGSGWWFLAAGATPWLVLRGRDSIHKGGKRRAPLVLLQYGVGDLVTFLSLVEGSIRHRRLVL